MYDRLKNQYIFKLSNGKTINIYYKENTGLCAAVLNRRNMWAESAVLVRDCQRAFSADIDKGDIIHIFYQDSRSNLSEILYSDSGHIIKPVLKSTDVSPFDRSPITISTDSGHYYIYVTEYDNNKLLMYQTRQPDSTFAQPKMIDYIIGTKHSYCAFPDNDGNIVIFYLCADSQSKSIGIKRINALKDIGNDFLPLSSSSENSFILGGFCDSGGIYHLLWDVKNENKYELRYESFLPDKNISENEQIINISDISHINSSIIESNSAILCFWCWDNSIYFSIASEDMIFSTPEKYNQFEGRQIYCITYRSNYSERSAGIKGCSLPGSFVNGYSLGFTETPVKMPPVKVIGQLPVYENINSLRQDIADDKSYGNLLARLEALEKKVEKIEIEAARESIKKIKQEIINNEETKNPTEIMSSSPIMPGSGFSSVTAEFLKNLGKK